MYWSIFNTLGDVRKYFIAFLLKGGRGGEEYSRCFVVSFLCSLLETNMRCWLIWLL